MVTNDPPLTRRKLLALGGSGMAATLAGCTFEDPFEEDDNNEQDYSKNWRENVLAKKEEVIEAQCCEIPPVKKFYPYYNGMDKGDPKLGYASVLWEKTDEFYPEDSGVVGPSQYSEIEKDFADKLTFELFIYTDAPTENESVDLTKIAEKTTGLGLWDDTAWDDDGELKEDAYKEKPYPLSYPDHKNVYLEYDPSVIPRNQPVRFRLRITNNRTGKQEFAHDSPLIYTINYDDELEFILSRSEGVDIREGSPYDTHYPQDRVVEETEEYYKFAQRVQTRFPARVHEVLPYSWEAKSELHYRGSVDDKYLMHSDWIKRGDFVKISRDGVELTRNWADELNMTSKDDIQFRRSIPEEYDYYGRDTYDVLDNPVIKKFTDNINKAMDDYGVDNHYARIQSAVRLIQGFDYGEMDGANYYLPDSYFSESVKGDCVSHTLNLMWTLYHLGYATGFLYLVTPTGSGAHTAPVVGVPDDVLAEDFPDYIEQTYEVTEDTISNNKYDWIEDYAPNSVGDLNWIYLEATASPVREYTSTGQHEGVAMGQSGRGIIYKDYSFEAVLEPEDPWFETGISNALPDR